MALKNYEIVLVFSLSKGEEAAQALKTKFTDLILYACNIRFDCLSVGKFFFSILKCIVWRDLIFFPHIGNLTFPLLLNFFCLTSQTEAFFIQKRSLF